MNIEEYQKRAVATALPTALNYDYLLPGLVAEVVLLFRKVAKAVRDEWSRELLLNELKADLGYVFWFLVLVALLSYVHPYMVKTVGYNLA